MNSEFAELVTKYEEDMKKLRDDLSSKLNESFKEVFETYPELTTVYWTQYTPYFNDGDTCEFYVNEFFISNAKNMDDAQIYDYDGEDDNEWVLDSCDKEAKKYKLVWDISDFAQSSLGYDLFQTMFGDHALVRVTRDGIDVEEYDHD